jgi:ribosomal protein S18 acetylase RimI-like enzyme
MTTTRIDWLPSKAFAVTVECDPWAAAGRAIAARAQMWLCIGEEVGKRKVNLEVDAENPTGATRLYEKAGMRVARRQEPFEKELRPSER